MMEPLGGVAKVTAINRYRSRVRGRPERSSSNSPATPWASYRARQLIAVWRDTDNRRAISARTTPPPASNTIRARSIRPAFFTEDRPPFLQFGPVTVRHHQRRGSYAQFNQT
jgi:hypothetical protein